MSSRMDFSWVESCPESSWRYAACSALSWDKPSASHLTSKRRMWLVDSWFYTKSRVSHHEIISYFMHVLWEQDAGLGTFNSLCSASNLRLFSLVSGVESLASCPAGSCVNTLWHHTDLLPTSLLMKMELWISWERKATAERNYCTWIAYLTFLYGAHLLNYSR